MRGLSIEERVRARRASTVMRRATMPAFGDDAVVGLAIPGGKVEDFDVGRDEGERVLKHARALPVARDMDERGGALGSGCGEPAGEVGGDEGVEAVGRMGERERSAFREFGYDALEFLHEGGLSGGVEAARLRREAQWEFAPAGNPPSLRGLYRLFELARKGAMSPWAINVKYELGGVGPRPHPWIGPECVWKLFSLWNSAVSYSAGVGSASVSHLKMSGSGASISASKASRSASGSDGEVRVRELAHEDVHLLHAAMPGAEQHAPAAGIEACGGDGGGHGRFPGE